MASIEIGVKQQDALFSPEEEEALFSRSKIVHAFVSRKGAACTNPAMEYKSRLGNFSKYIFQRHQEAVEPDEFIGQLKEGVHDQYEVLADFSIATREVWQR